jgi:sugar O-acyltransferase (sialic acid O-acetyltransferase NeuD family)
MQRIAIIGAGGHGRETLDVVEAMNLADPRFEVAGFVADRADAELLARRGVPLLGPLSWLAEHDVAYVIGIGSSEARRSVDEEVRAMGREGVVLVHPAATMGADLRLGEGVILAAGARVTTNVTLGRHTHLNVNAVVSHDCEVGSYVTYSPGVLVNGNNLVGDGAFFGTASVVLPGRTIGAGARIGAGAVVTRDVPPGVTARGVPARW